MKIKFFNKRKYFVHNFPGKRKRKRRKKVRYWITWVVLLFPFRFSSGEFLIIFSPFFRGKFCGKILNTLSTQKQRSFREVSIVYLKSFLITQPKPHWNFLLNAWNYFKLSIFIFMVISQSIHSATRLESLFVVKLSVTKAKEEV